MGFKSSPMLLPKDRTNFTWSNNHNHGISDGSTLPKVAPLAQGMQLLSSPSSASVQTSIQCNVQPTGQSGRRVDNQSSPAAVIQVTISFLYSSSSAQTQKYSFHDAPSSCTWPGSLKPCRGATGLPMTPTTNSPLHAHCCWLNQRQLCHRLQQCHHQGDATRQPMVTSRSAH